jgi:hypothetical protein
LGRALAHNPMAWLGPTAQPAWLAHASSAAWARPRGGHRAWGAHGGAAVGSSPTASTWRGLHLKHRRRATQRPGKVVGTGTHQGNGAEWRRREAIGVTDFNGGEALRWETTATEGSCGTPMTRGWWGANPFGGEGLRGAAHREAAMTAVGWTQGCRRSRGKVSSCFEEGGSRGWGKIDGGSWWLSFKAEWRTKGGNGVGVWYGWCHTEGAKEGGSDTRGSGAPPVEALRCPLDPRTAEGDGVLTRGPAL